MDARASSALRFWGRGSRPHQDHATRDRRRRAGSEALRPVRRRRLADEAPEQAAEGAKALEPDEDAHLRHAEVGGPEQVLRSLDTAPGQIGPRCLAVRLRKGPGEVVLGVAGLAGKCVEIERLGIGSIDEVVGLANRGEGVRWDRRNGSVSAPWGGVRVIVAAPIRPPSGSLRGRARARSCATSGR